MHGHHIFIRHLFFFTSFFFVRIFPKPFLAFLESAKPLCLPPKPIPISGQKIGLYSGKCGLFRGEAFILSDHCCVSADRRKHIGCSLDRYLTLFCIRNHTLQILYILRCNAGVQFDRHPILFQPSDGIFHFQKGFAVSAELLISLFTRPVKCDVDPGRCVPAKPPGHVLIDPGCIGIDADLHSKILHSGKDFLKIFVQKRLPARQKRKQQTTFCGIFCNLKPPLSIHQSACFLHFCPAFTDITHFAGKITDREQFKCPGQWDSLRSRFCP